MINENCFSHYHNGKQEENCAKTSSNIFFYIFLGMWIHYKTLVDLVYFEKNIFSFKFMVK